MSPELWPRGAQTQFQSTKPTHPGSEELRTAVATARGTEGKHTAKHHRIKAHESRKVRQDLERRFLHGNSCLVRLLAQYMRAMKTLLTASTQHQRGLSSTGSLLAHPLTSCSHQLLLQL